PLPIARLHQTVCEALPCRTAVRRAIELTSELPLRLFVAAELNTGVATRPQHIIVVSGDGKRPIVESKRSVEATYVDHKHAAIEQGTDVTWGQGQRLLIALKRFRLALERSQGRSPIVQRVDVMRLGRQNSFIARERFERAVQL